MKRFLLFLALWPALLFGQVYNPKYQTIKLTAPNLIFDTGTNGVLGFAKNSGSGQMIWALPQISDISGLQSALNNISLTPGPKGDTGSTGLTGPKGDPGTNGAKGDPGTTGANGPPNVLSIGTVSTGAAGSSALATITGSSPSQTLNLTIPQGLAGSNATATTDASQLTSGLLPDARLNTTIARSASPAFTGTPTAPTAAAATSSTQIATTEFATTADNLKANIASPTFTGTPAAPTAARNTNTTQLATTGHVFSMVRQSAWKVQSNNGGATTLTGDYTVQPNDTIVRFNTSGGVINCTMPDPSTNIDRILIIQLVTAGNRLNFTGSVNGATNYYMDYATQCIFVVSIGTIWLRMAGQ